MDEGHACPRPGQPLKGLAACELGGHQPVGRDVPVHGRDGQEHAPASLPLAEQQTQALPFLKQDGLLYALGVSSPR